MKEITFTNQSRFRPYEIKRLWVLYGAPLKTVMDMTESLMHNLLRPVESGAYIYDEEQQDTQWTAFI